MKGKGKRSNECPKGKGRLFAVTEEEGQQEGQQGEWSQDGELELGVGWFMLVHLMIGLVTGLGPMMAGVTGPMTGHGARKIGGMRNSRWPMQLPVRKARVMSLKTPPRVSHPRMLQP